MRIGIFGGTFDPFHNGHMMIVRYVLDNDIVDRLIVVPSSVPRLRDEEPSASPENRFRMACIALHGCKGVDVSRLELDKPGTSYTVDTLTDVISLHGREHEYILIVGMDAFLRMSEWFSLKKILAMSRVAVIGRPSQRCSPNAFSAVPSASYFEGMGSIVSGREVRGRIRRGESVYGMVHPDVVSFIYDKGLYDCQRSHDIHGGVK